MVPCLSCTHDLSGTLPEENQTHGISCPRHVEPCPCQCSALLPLPSLPAARRRQLHTLHEAAGVMRRSMLGVIAGRRRELAVAAPVPAAAPEPAPAGREAAAAVAASTAAAAAAAPFRDVLDVLLQARDDDGVPMTGQRATAGAPVGQGYGVA